MEKSVRRIPVWHQEACSVTTNGDPEGSIFQTNPHTNYGYSFPVPIKFLLFYLQKRLPEAPEYAEMQHNMITS